MFLGMVARLRQERNQYRKRVRGLEEENNRLKMELEGEKEKVLYFEDNTTWKQLFDSMTQMDD